ncbi:hypothetical protein [Niveibacterium sp.]|uniref:hypothetical protein n=1 Tax=Niveibacterium sp. TaxID=2017444 RepID=UPI0035AEF796
MRLLRSLLLATAVAHMLPAFANEDEVFEFRYRTDTPMGTSFPTVRTLHGPIPYDKAYSALSARQKEIVRSDYELAPGDEPPFPSNGLGSLYSPLLRTLDKLNSVVAAAPFSGPLLAVLNVDATGAVSNVVFYKAPEGAEIRNSLALTFMKVKFDPGTRGGKPADTEFLIDTEIGSCDSSVQGYSAAARCK